ncbi:outer membrane beta-barrel protein [Rhodothermus sp. AH-315-K08]|nr:outer membrane beta-barrel protein [Rhodothermus sp. AH-315-K08]
MTYNRYHFILALAPLLGNPLSASAQTRGQFGFDFSVAIPQGAFAQNVNQPGFGGNFHAGIQLKNSPFLVGIDAGIQVYGYESRWVPLSNTIPDITARVETTNNIAQFHGLLRLQAPEGSVRPYIDGLYGFKYLYTRTSLQDDLFDEEVLGSTNFDDFALSYGFGAGIDIRLYDGPMGEDERQGSVYLSLGARYLLGGEAEFLREGDIERLPGAIRFTTTRSRVDLFQPRIGVTLAF